MAFNSKVFSKKPDVAKKWSDKYGSKVRAKKKNNPYKSMRA